MTSISYVARTISSRLEPRFAPFLSQKCTLSHRWLSVHFCEFQSLWDGSPG
jgi:hypothetical protein